MLFDVLLNLVFNALVLVGSAYFSLASANSLSGEDIFGFEGIVYLIFASLFSLIVEFISIAIFHLLGDKYFRRLGRCFASMGLSNSWASALVTFGVFYPIVGFLTFSILRPAKFELLTGNPLEILALCVVLGISIKTTGGKPWVNLIEF
jgi:hypothetical protein